MVIKTINTILDWFSSGYQKKANIVLFEKLLYLWFIIEALWFFNIRGMLWGTDSFFMIPQHSQGVLNNLYYFLIYNRGYADLIYFTHIAAAVLALFGWFRWIPKFIVYLTGYMMFYAAWPAYNGGFMLCLLYSFFLMFSYVKSKKTFWIVLSNLALVACMVQLCLVYSEAAVYKMTGVTWWNGDSIWRGLHFDEYSGPWIRNLLLDQTILLIFFNIIAFAYQSLFVFIVWFKKLKYPVLIIGLIFHLFIAFFMNIPDFGFAMIIGYALFIDESLSAKILSLVRIKV